MMNNTFDKFIEKLKSLYKERLVSVIVYGSCAEEECSAVCPDINSIVIIDKLEAADLETLQPLLKDWVKTKSPVPLFMDREEWFNSTDVYPIEYSDIKARYRIVYGEDIVEPIVLDHKNLRHQCEYELKSLLIKLRQSYVIKHDLKGLVKSGSKTLKALLRAVSLLTKEPVPVRNQNETIKELIDNVLYLLKYVDKLEE